VPTTEYAAGWGFHKSWLSQTNYPKVKGAQPDAEILRWIAVCESYMKHDPEADVSRPLCFKVHGGRVCRRLEGHDDK
jgi:hypothetical protein